MGTPGAILLDSSGNRLLDSSGNLLIYNTGGCACCGGSGGTPCCACVTCCTNLTIAITISDGSYGLLQTSTGLCISSYTGPLIFQPTLPCPSGTTKVFWDAADVSFNMEIDCGAGTGGENLLFGYVVASFGACQNGSPLYGLEFVIDSANAGISTTATCPTGTFPLYSLYSSPPNIIGSVTVSP